MKTKNLENLKFKNDDMKSIVRAMLRNGYRVFAYDNSGSISDFVYANNITVAYAQWARLRGRLEISTKHIPNKRIGSGFGDVYEGYISHDDPNLFKIMDLGLGFAPNWVQKKDLEYVKKYTVSSWISSAEKGILDYYEIKDYTAGGEA